MQKSIGLLLFITLSFFSAEIKALPSLDEFYNVFQSEDEAKIEALVKTLGKDKLNDDWQARYGALQMKRSSFLSTPKTKLETFKAGKVILEERISEDPDNIEYRFLRLAIQENCPRILRYYSEIDEDVEAIKRGIDRVSSKIEFHIKEYAKRSENLEF